MKTGLDYFSLDVDYFNDQKLEFVSAKFGAEGELVAIRLLCGIYRNGYYLNWGQDELLLFSKKLGVGHEKVKEIVQELLNRGFFNGDLFKKYGILTSNGIQKRFLEATRRRKEVTVYQEYLIANINGYNVDIIELNVSNPTAKKAKKTRTNTDNNYFDLFWEAYPRKMSKGYAEKLFSRLNPDDELMAKIMAAIVQAKKTDGWKRDDGKFIPYPATWLNAKGWEDEYSAKTGDGKWPVR